MQRCRLPVDPRGTAVTVTGRSQRTRIRSGILDFPSVNLIHIRGKEPAPLFENNTGIYIERLLTDPFINDGRSRYRVVS